MTSSDPGHGGSSTRRPVAAALVRLACRLYPRRLHDRLPEDLAAVFERQYEATLEADGRLAALWLFARTLGGVLKEAGAERLDALGRSGPRDRLERNGRSTMGLRTDLRLAVRTLARQPWSTAAIVATLALGIGATTAVYAVFNYAVFRPVPGIVEPERLVTLFVWPDHETPNYGYLDDDHLRAIRAMPAFEGLVPLHGWSFPFRVDPTAAPESRSITLVSHGYFDLLGVEPRLGRLFREEEYDQPSPVAVISEKLWRSHYGGDPSVIGNDAFIREHRFTIVGVARDFQGLANIGRDGVWVPRGAAGLAESNPAYREYHQHMVARLAPGRTLEVARQQAAEAVAAAGGIRFRDEDYTAVVFPGLNDPLGGGRARLMPIFWTAMAGVSILLLLACVNAANLFAARNVRRRRNLALKAALGASRLRVLREMMVEAVLVAVLAAAAGLGTGAAMTALFRSERLLLGPQTLEDLTVDWRVGASAAFAACASVLLAAGIPSFLAARWDPQRGLREFGQGASRAAGRLRDTFVTIQVALSIALVACTGVLAQTLVNLETKDLGFDLEGLYEVILRPSSIGYDAQRATQLYGELERRLAETPGIEAATFGSGFHLVADPAAGLATSSGETLRGPEEPIFVRRVPPSYLRTLGIPLLAGRTFTAQEAAAGTSAHVVVIDRSLAEEVFADEPAIGRQLHLVYGGPAEAYEVIGVAADTGDLALREEHRPALYMPVGSLATGVVQVRSRLPAGETAALIRGVLRDIEPLLPADDIVAVRDRIAQFTAQERVLAKLGLVLAGLALGIAIAGVYAAMASRVVERTHELGIRMALGASRAALGMGVLRRAVAVSGLGIAGGLVLYAWGSRFIEARLYGVASLDPPTLAAGTLLILIAALVAAWLPARRATRVDPTIAMRDPCTT